MKFSSRVAFSNFRVGRSKGGFVLSKHLRIWNCSSLQRAHTLPSPFAMTFYTTEFMKNFADFPLLQFSISKLFWLIFFLFYVGKNNLWWNITKIVQEIYSKLVSWQMQTSFSLPSNQWKFDNILWLHKNLLESFAQKFETLWKIIQIFYFTGKRRTKNSSWKTFFVLNFPSFISLRVFFVFPTTTTQKFKGGR